MVRDGKAYQVPVETGARTEQRIEITKGLTGTEEVIVSGKDLVHDGIAVQARPLNTDVKRTS